MDEWLWVLLNVGDIDLPKQAQQNQRKEHNRNTKQKGGQLLPHGPPRRGIFTVRNIKTTINSLNFSLKPVDHHVAPW